MKTTARTNKKGVDEQYVECIIRHKEIKLTPEELVRQLYTHRLINEYGYAPERIQFEYPIKMGREEKRIDIVIFDARDKTQPYIIVEVKQPKEKSGKQQMESYCKASGASIGVLFNGRDMEEFFLRREDKKSKVVTLEKLSELPNANQDLADILDGKFTLKNLLQKDELQNKTLKQIIHDFEDVVLANAGVNSFEEIFKLLFTKLYDEVESSDDADRLAHYLEDGKTLDEIDDSKFRAMEFRSSRDENRTFDRVNKLFAEAQDKWRGIFPKDAKFNLTKSHLKICVSFLQNVKLFNSNLEVVDDAFEYLVNKEQKGDKGQYFTPRHVIDMCVKMLNPQPHEKMIDPAAGSCGFPIHVIFYVWNLLNPDLPNLLTTQRRSNKEYKYVNDNVFAIDFDPLSVRVGRTLNLIAGDGQTNVLRLNTLDYGRWDDTTNDNDWRAEHNEGFVRLQKVCKDKSHQAFDFDVLMANPPFAGDISDEDIISLYPNLGVKEKGKRASKVGRDILFIERNLNFLKDGGRMAIVLPQGRFNNSSDKYVRNFIAERCRILAVVGLHGNVFKPHTGTKTSVLFVQKWDAKLCPRKDDYPIFFATMQEPSKDNSGEKIYEKDSSGNLRRDKHGHIFVKHDLFNHDGLTQDGIAEAFIEFAKKENLSFF